MFPVEFSKQSLLQSQLFKKKKTVNSMVLQGYWRVTDAF